MSETPLTTSNISSNFSILDFHQSNINVIISSTRHTILDEFINIIKDYTGDNISRDKLLLKIIDICNNINLNTIKEQLEKWEEEKKIFINIQKNKQDELDWNKLIKFPQTLQQNKNNKNEIRNEIKNKILNTNDTVDNINIDIKNLSKKMDSLFDLIMNHISIKKEEEVETELLEELQLKDNCNINEEEVVDMK